ncbi:MAG: arsenate reductase ArsC [Magnetococcales bacterium]|nr:arsenate reductase ArsC [Magnetococcales bacterium]
MSLLNVLFLCTHNSARSIMAEAILNHEAKGRVQGFSAGSHPRGEVHPLALQALKKRGMSIDGLHSKAWDDFAMPDAPRMSVVITVCDSAAGEMCPIWPGAPIKSHWGVEEPGRLAEGKDNDEALQAFFIVMEKLERRIRRFLELPLESMGAASIKLELDVIERMN